MQQSAQKILRRRLLRAIALPIGLLLLLSGISIWQITGLLAAIGWVDHTDQVISQSNQVQKLLLDMETGNRGYLLTGEDIFLEPYQQGSAQIPEALNRLKQLVRDNPYQLRRVEDLQQRQTAWNRLVLQTLTPQQDQAAQTTAQTAALRSRKQEMDMMRGLIANFITTEEQLRDDRVRTVQQTTWLVTVTIVGLAIAIGVLLAYFSWQQLRKVAQTYTQMMNSVHIDAQTNIAGIIDIIEIAQDISDRKHFEENQLAIAIQQSQLRQQLQRHASELEQRVADRTAELSATNQALEAFTYSVSHDLRAPLRTMQGFAQALIEDYGDQLDDIAHSYIESLVEDAKQMSRLIADLLAYSRLSRTQINPQPIDLNEAIADALKQVATEVQEKQANITVPKSLVPESLPSVLAHRTTLVQILTNLLSNAIKFVPPGTQPKISISTSIYTKEDRRKSQTWVKLTVKDNGIGIAPEHRERIFRVFERLHGIEIYPGTGIGLAIVRKGIERMGGFTGVESQLGQGSQFWIILPKAVLKNSDTHDYSSATD